jgi:protein gp37
VNRTSIQWTWRKDAAGVLIPSSGFTWNPLVGCRRVSPGCENCYAERLIATRLSKHRVYEGLAVMGTRAPMLQRVRPQFTGEHRLIADRLDEPLRKKSAKGCKVFVNDLGDLFYEGHTFEEIAAVFGVMAACPDVTFQVLTKRIDRALEFLAWLTERIARAIADGVPAKLCAGAEPAICLAYAMKAGVMERALHRDLGAWCPPWPLPNVWLGVSVEDQKRADERIPLLLKAHAAVRFLSCEPLLGPITFEDERLGWLAPFHETDAMLRRTPRVDWVIVGGESGPGARPFDVQWARSLVAQCRDAGVACFVKQLGARPFDGRSTDDKLDADPRSWITPLLDSHGGDPEEWPEDLRVRAFPRTEATS